MQLRIWGSSRQLTLIDSAPQRRAGNDERRDQKHFWSTDYCRLRDDSNASFWSHILPPYQPECLHQGHRRSTWCFREARRNDTCDYKQIAISARLSRRSSAIVPTSATRITEKNRKRGCSHRWNCGAWKCKYSFPLAFCHLLM